MSESNISGNLFDLKILRRLLVFCRPYMKVFYILIILTLSLSVLQPIRPYITQIIIDDYVTVNDLIGLKKMILLLFFLLILNAIVMYFHTYLSGWLGQNIIKDIRIKEIKTDFFKLEPVSLYPTYILIYRNP